MSINIVVVGQEQVTAHIARLDDDVRSRLTSALQDIGVSFIEYVKSNKLSGSPLTSRTGNLANSLRSEVVSTDDGISLTASANTPYAAIQEYGGTTSPHIIEPKNKSVLRFMMNGKAVFASRVNHPGSKIPSRSYMRSSLTEMEPQIVSRLQAAIDGIT